MYPPYKFGSDPGHFCSCPAFVRVTQRMRLNNLSVPTIQFDTALSRGDIDLLIGVRKKSANARQIMAMLIFRLMKEAHHF